MTATDKRIHQIELNEMELARIAGCLTTYLRENSKRISGTAYGESLESILIRIKEKLNED